jgi:hypothetical protein
MLTLKKVLTKKRCSVRVFKMIELKPIKNIYMYVHNNMNKLMLFESGKSRARSGSHYLRGE